MAAVAYRWRARRSFAAGCAVEMIHAYSLIHDDLPAMDDDDLRRGQPTCHKKYGEALAILAGDALQTLAFQLLAESYPPLTAAACCRELARAAGAGMVGGQVDDLAWEREAQTGGGIGPGNEPRSIRSTDWKTCTPARPALIRASLRLGVLAAHAARSREPHSPRTIRLLWPGVGLAFQITDDLLDVEGQVEPPASASARTRPEES